MQPITIPLRQNGQEPAIFPDINGASGERTARNLPTFSCHACISIFHGFLGRTSFRHFTRESSNSVNRGSKTCPPQNDSKGGAHWDSIDSFISPLVLDKAVEEVLLMTQLFELQSFFRDHLDHEKYPEVLHEIETIFSTQSSCEWENSISQVAQNMDEADCQALIEIAQNRDDYASISQFIEMTFLMSMVD